MSTPEQPASDAAKPSDEAVKAAEALSPLFMDNGEERNAAHIIDRETNLPELKASLAYLGPLMPVLEAREAKALKQLAFVQAQLATQQAALSAAKDALEEVAKAVLQYQKVCPADPDTTRQFLLAGADLDCAMSVTTTALAQIRALGNT